MKQRRIATTYRISKGKLNSLVIAVNIMGCWVAEKKKVTFIFIDWRDDSINFAQDFERSCYGQSKENSQCLAGEYIDCRNCILQTKKTLRCQLNQTWKVLMQIDPAFPLSVICFHRIRDQCVCKRCCTVEYFAYLSLLTKSISWKTQRAKTMADRICSHSFDAQTEINVARTAILRSQRESFKNFELIWLDHQPSCFNSVCNSEWKSMNWPFRLQLRIARKCCSKRFLSVFILYLSCQGFVQKGKRFCPEKTKKAIYCNVSKTSVSDDWLLLVLNFFPLVSWAESDVQK